MKIKMLKSSLNPNAAPFFPSYLNSSAARDGKVEKVESVKSVDHVGTDVHHGIVTLEPYDQNQDLYFFGVTPVGDADVASKHALECWKHGSVEDFDSVAEILTLEYPNVSWETLAELYSVNGGDLEETLNMLEQLEEPLDAAIPVASDTNSIEVKHIEVASPQAADPN